MAIQNGDIVSWNVSLSLRGGSSAEISLSSDDTSIASTSTLGETYEIYTKTNDVSQLIFNGIVSDINVSKSGSDPAIKYEVSLSTFATSLDRKPINTETFTSTNGNTLLTTILSRYGSMQTPTFDFTSASSTTFNYITVVGDSIIAAVRLIAQASGNELFVDSDGILKTESYATSSGATTIDSKDIVSMEKIVSNLDGFSVVRVRGRYQSLDETGGAEWLNTNVSFLPTSDTFTFDTFISTGSSVAEVRAAVWTTSLANVSVVVLSVQEDGKVKIRLSKAGSAWPGGTSVSVSVIATGPTLWLVERQSLSLQTIQNIKPRAARSDSSHIDANGPRQGFVNWSWRSQKEADAKEEARIDIVGYCSSLITEFGVRWFEIDNPYIPTISDAQNVGCRMITEFLMSREVYSINISWGGDIGINDSVQFTDIISGSTKVGVVTKLDISYNIQSADFPATIVVEIFDTATCGGCGFD